MIDFKYFRLACPPFTGSTWCLKACAQARLGEGSKADLHQPHRGPSDGLLTVSTVRNPIPWLQSYWVNGGHTGVPEVDAFLPWRNEAEDFPGFLRTYLNKGPGQIGKMFFSYNANNYIRTDMLAPAFKEMLALTGVPVHSRSLVIGFPPQNVTKRAKPKVPPHFLDLIYEAESDLIEHFDF